MADRDDTIRGLIAGFPGDDREPDIGDLGPAVREFVRDATDAEIDRLLRQEKTRERREAIIAARRRETEKVGFKLRAKVLDGIAKSRERRRDKQDAVCLHEPEFTISVCRVLIRELTVLADDEEREFLAERAGERLDRYAERYADNLAATILDRHIAELWDQQDDLRRACERAGITREGFEETIREAIRRRMAKAG